MNGNNGAKSPGTPSKHNKAQMSAPPRRTRSSDGSGNVGAPPPMWKTLRWILLGFGVGAATTALFHSVNLHIPTVRVELEYADAPDIHHIQQKLGKRPHITKTGRAGKQTPLVSGSATVDKKNKDWDAQRHDTDDDTDDGVNREEAKDPAVQEERQRIAQEIQDIKELAILDNKEENTAKDLHAIANAHKQAEAEEAKHEEEEAENDSDNKSNAEEEFVPEEQDPDFSNPGPPPKLEAGEAFAACILIKDDNHWLIEWLAYHYHVMPLRYLIVAIDPESKTSPIPILKRWKDRKLMTISIWDDKMFMPNKIMANPLAFDNNTELMMHRVRQNNFYFKCMRTFKQRNREWLMLIDTDEYIVTNYASGLYYNLTKNIPITMPGNVLTFIKQHHQITGENHTCSYMPRYMFGVKESSREMVQRHLGPHGLNGTNFLTQRFLYRNPRRMHNGKNLINIRKLPQIKTYTSVHHVSSYCPDPDKMRTVNHVKKALVRVHHYLGTAEQYFFRDDPREPKPPKNNSTKAGNNATKPKPKSSMLAYFTRGKGRYQNLNRRATYPDQGARAWIRGFIEHVGIQTARELLKGVGQVGYQ